MDLYPFITRRKSIRKYRQEPLPGNRLQEILAYAKNLRALDEKIPYAILPATGAEISGMMAVKAPHYLVIYSDSTPEATANAGFLLAQMDLYLSAQGLGSCFLGMAKPREKTHAGLSGILTLAFGTPEEALHRKSIDEFSRKPLGEICRGQDSRMEAVRLAPSAVNGQPWYFICNKGSIDVYRKKLGLIKAKIFGSLQAFDMGIALCYLWLASEAEGRPFSYQFGGTDPDDVPGDCLYMGRVEG